METDDDDDFGIKTGSAFETGGTNTNEFNSDDVLERETVGDAGGVLHLRGSILNLRGSRRGVKKVPKGHVLA